jgi:hypothetical protein
MRRAALATWSNLPNRNRLRFYTAWVIRVDFVIAKCPLSPCEFNRSVQHRL